MCSLHFIALHDKECYLVQIDRYTYQVSWVEHIYIRIRTYNLNILLKLLGLGPPSPPCILRGQMSKLSEQVYKKFL